MRDDALCVCGHALEWHTQGPRGWVCVANDVPEEGEPRRPICSCSEFRKAAIVTGPGSSPSTDPRPDDAERACLRIRGLIHDSDIGEFGPRDLTDLIATIEEIVDEVCSENPGVPVTGPGSSPSNVPDLAERKRAITRERRAAKRVRRRASRRCFWTWPFGHVWVREDEFSDWTCWACGRTQRMVWADA